METSPEVDIDKLIADELQKCLSGEVPASEGPSTATEGLLDKDVGTTVYAVKGCNVWELCSEAKAKERLRNNSEIDMVTADSVPGIVDSIRYFSGIGPDEPVEIVKPMGCVNDKRGAKEYLQGLVAASNMSTEELLSKNDQYSNFNARDFRLEHKEHPFVSRDIEFGDLVEVIEKHKKVIVNNKQSPKLYEYIQTLWQAERALQKVGSYDDIPLIVRGYLFKMEFYEFTCEILTKRHLTNMASKATRQKNAKKLADVKNHYRHIDQKMKYYFEDELLKSVSWFCNLKISRLPDMLRAAKSIGKRTAMRNTDEYKQVISRVKPELMSCMKSRSRDMQKLARFFVAEHKRLYSK